jgi:hypothetical protein
LDVADGGAGASPEEEPGAVSGGLAMASFSPSSYLLMQGGYPGSSGSGRRVLTIADVEEAALELKESLVLKMKRVNAPRLHTTEVESLVARLPARIQQVILVSVCSCSWLHIT